MKALFYTTVLALQAKGLAVFNSNNTSSSYSCNFDLGPNSSYSFASEICSDPAMYNGTADTDFAN